jgi:hypothetical protein
MVRPPTHMVGTFSDFFEEIKNRIKLTKPKLNGGF